MLIGICGLISSGKGTVADILVGQYGFTKVSFADSLKDAVAAVFSWPREMLEGDTDESRRWRETVDQWWAKRLERPNLTPRWVLQYWGTEVCRQGFHQDIWISSLERKLLNLGVGYRAVVPDTRFPNEIEMIASMGGSVWRVSRGDDPQWLLAWKGGDDKLVKELGIHASEYMWARNSHDVHIKNDGSLSDLQAKVLAAVQDLNKP